MFHLNCALVNYVQEFEEHEEERGKFMQNMLYKYVDLHIRVHEKSAEVSQTIIITC